MNQIEGPENQRRPIFNHETEQWEAAPRDLCECNVTSLGEAIDFYSRKFNVTITPYDGKNPHVPLDNGEKKYFYYSKNDSDRTSLIDIHIIGEDGVNTCPKQDVDYRVPPNSTISIGELIC